jgi:hypothetical protein
VQESDFVKIIEMMENSAFFSSTQVEMFQDEAFKFLKLKNSSSLTHLYRLLLSLYKESLESSLTAKRSTSISASESDSSSSSSSSNKRKRLRGPSIAERLPVASIFSTLIALETNPDSWKQLQFLHISNFSQGKCVNCDRAICFRCGESTWHRGTSCEGYLSRKLSSQKGSSDSLANLKWKLSNSKACPKCCIFIARDEGCNKVDCVNCGHRFCWICLHAWSEDCGFYRCSIQQSEETGGGGGNDKLDDKSHLVVPRSALGAVSKDDEDFRVEVSKPETGVPNVHALFKNIIERNSSSSSSSNSNSNSNSSPPPPPPPPLTDSMQTFASI